MARNLGVRFLADSDEQLATHGAAYWGAFTLGVAAVTPLDLANAYATVAAGGKYCAPRAVNAVADRDGNAVPVGAPACRQAVTRDVAAAAADAARCPVQQQGYYGKCDGGTAPTGFGSLLGRPMGGKTGTTDGEATATFVGFTPQLAAAAIAADPDNPQHYVGEAYANKVDFAVGYTLRDSSAGMPVVQFPKPSAGIAGVGTAKPKRR
jgi:membrane peptidoglycan carboxypeptidase